MQNGPHQSQPTTKRARATAAALNNQQSRMTNKGSHSGFKEAARGCTEKSMSNSREYQFIYQTAINNTTTNTNQKCSIGHTVSTSEDMYYFTVGTAPVKHRQQQQSGCAHTNKAIDGTGANFQSTYSIRNNSMIQQQTITSRNNTYSYAVAMYDSIDIYVLIPHESRGGNMQQSVVISHT